VKRHAHYVTRRDGGAGAVREAVELILAAQSRLAAAEAAHGAHPDAG
jgi:3-deoxy-D-manno-octulosonate 8-phosphate phosphatase KdsC-like HAD superfamily phosphatase